MMILQSRGFYKTNIEKDMVKILNDLKIDFAQFFPIRGTKLELDFAIPDKKICIEADGNYCGLGDSRPEFGRFDVEKFEVIK